jgi:hypothetical protein
MISFSCPALGMFALFCVIANTHASITCPRLSSTLSYTQSNAPRDISSILRVVVEKVNRELEGEKNGQENGH